METEAIKNLVLAALDDMKAVDIKLLDVRERSTFTDYMIVVSGTSDRHVYSVADKTIEKLKAAGVRPLGMEGSRGGGWMLVDFGAVVLHVMKPDVRSFYNLEKLWSV